MGSVGSLRPGPHGTFAVDAPSAVCSQYKFSEANKMFCIILLPFLFSSEPASCCNKLLQDLPEAFT